VLAGPRSTGLAAEVLRRQHLVATLQRLFQVAPLAGVGTPSNAELSPARGAPAAADPPI
jgi:hypothetical protein